MRKISKRKDILNLYFQKFEGANEMNEKSQMITQSTILAMGLTKTMIKNLLPEPTERPNPHYKCAAPMKLWEQGKVLEIMETEDFKRALEKASKRKNAAKSVAKTKENLLLNEINKLVENIEIKVIPDDKLIKKTVAAKNLWYSYQDDMRGTFYEHRVNCNNIDDYTLARWIVNYIRHNLVKYDQTIENLKGKIGKDKAYFVFKKAVLDKIASVYPKYAAECKRQADTIGVTCYA